MKLFKAFNTSDVYGQRYSDGYTDDPVKGPIPDEDVAKLVNDHIHWWDRFDIRKICEATLYAQGMLVGWCPMPKKDKWYF